MLIRLKSSDLCHNFVLNIDPTLVLEICLEISHPCHELIILAIGGFLLT